MPTVLTFALKIRVIVLLFVALCQTGTSLSTVPDRCYNPARPKLPRASPPLISDERPDLECFGL